MEARWKAVLAATAAAQADMTFCEPPSFKGRSFPTTDAVNDFGRSGLNTHVSSVIVLGDLREARDKADFRGRCVVLWTRPYPSRSAMALDDRISPSRPFGRQPRSDDARHLPPANPAQDCRRCQNERIHRVDVAGVRDVRATPGQPRRVEPQPAAKERRDVPPRNGDASSARPVYWEVPHEFRGQEHPTRLSRAWALETPINL